MSKSSILVKNTTILAAGKLFSQTIGFLLLPLYTFYLNPQEYGFVDLVMVYILLLVPVLTLQLEMASFRYLVDARGSEKKKTRVISNIIYMLPPLVLPWIAIFIVVGLAFNIPHLWYILLTSLSVLCANMLLQMTRGLGGNKQFAIASIITGLTTLLGSLVFIVLLGMKIDGMLLSLTFANSATAIYLIIQQKFYSYIKRGQIEKKLQRDILGYSVPLVPNSAAWWVINASDRTIISFMIGTAANGVYAVSSKYSAILQSIFGVFSMSWTESASLHIDSPDRDEFFSKVSNSSLRVFGSLAIGLIATIPFIFPFMVDADFKEAYLYIPILVLGVFLNVIVGNYSAIYIAKRLTKQVMNTSVAAAILNVVLTVGLMPFFGLYAAAVGTAIAFLMMSIFRHYDVRKYVKITYEKNIFIVLTALYIVVVYLYYVDTLWASLVGLAIAIISAYLINRRDLKTIKNLVMKKFAK